MTPRNSRTASVDPAGDQYSEDLIKKAKNHRDLGSHCFRKECLKELDTYVQANRHVLLVGKPGSGKSYLIESLARIYADSGDQGLDMQRILTSSLISGTEERGSLENHFIRLINTAKVTKKVLILPSMHELLMQGATRDNYYGSIIYMLRDKLEDRKLVFIGSTTPEGENLLNRNAPWLSNKFQVIKLGDMDDENTIACLKDYVKQKHEAIGSIVDDHFYDYLMRMAKRIQSNLASPANAVNLFIKLCPDLERENKGISLGRRSIEIINKYAAKDTGLLEVLFNRQPLRRQDVIDAISKQYLGNEDKLARMVDFFLRFKAGLAQPGRPVASCLLAGPTGVGKTELVKAVARYFYPGGGHERIFTYDMSEYAGETSLRHLIGDRADPLTPGRLIKDIGRQSFSIFLFDEIEKAHPVVRNLLLQILGEGRIEDPYGARYSFENAFIFMSSNIGFGPKSKIYNYDRVDSDSVKRALQNELPRELLNRIDEVFIFDFLDANAIKQIVKKELGNLFQGDGPPESRRLFVERNPGAVSWVEELVDYIAARVDRKDGARGIKRTIEREIVYPLAGELCDGGDHTRFRIKVGNRGVEIIKEA